jgi:hypothetical protein
MSDESNTEKVRKGGRKVSELAEEVETKGLYIGIAGLFLLNSAGAFAASVPGFVFVVLFGAAVLIDAYN